MITKYTNRQNLLKVCHSLGIEVSQRDSRKNLLGKLYLLGMADDLGKRTRAMFLRTWDAIGSDWLTIGTDKDGCVSGASVQEAVADADRFDMYGKDKEAAAAWRFIPRENQDEILESIFPRKERFGA